MKKKIALIVFSLLLITGIAGTFWGPSIAAAATSIWNTCPKGKVNDAYPGDCNDYIDTNNDRICDRSQPAPQSTTTPTVSTGSALVSSSIGGATTGDTASVISGEGVAVDTTNAPISGRFYYLIPVLIGLIAAYGITWILSAKKVIKTLLHRKIWNVILLISFTVSTLLGIILILNIDFNTRIVPPFNILFWHVEAGIVLGVVAFLHIFWHWRYFAKMLKLANKAD